MREQIESAGFQRKNGAVFADETEHRGVTLDHATKEGAVVREGVEVRDVGLRDDGVRLTVEVAGGATEEVEAAFLVDASGRDALIASRPGRRVPLPDLGKAALFAHYRRARRASGRLEGRLQAYLLDVFFAPRPPATLKDALTTVFAGGRSSSNHSGFALGSRACAWPSGAPAGSGSGAASQWNRKLSW